MCDVDVPFAFRDLLRVATDAHHARMEEILSMSALVVIGVSGLVTAVVGLQLPTPQRLSALLALVAGAGAGLAALAVSMIAIPDTADDTAFAWGFLGSSILGALVVGLMLVRIVGSEREREG